VEYTDTSSNRLGRSFVFTSPLAFFTDISPARMLPISPAAVVRDLRRENQCGRRHKTSLAAHGARAGKPVRPLAREHDRFGNIENYVRKGLPLRTACTFWSHFRMWSPASSRGRRPQHRMRFTSLVVPTSRIVSTGATPSDRRRECRHQRLRSAGWSGTDRTRLERRNSRNRSGNCAGRSNHHNNHRKDAPCCPAAAVKNTELRGACRPCREDRPSGRGGWY